MEPLLYLVHRLPYPPNKGDKLRSFHLLRFLAARYDVHLGTFIDDAADRPHVEAVEQLCASVHVASIKPATARLRSLAGLLTGEALTLRYYADQTLRDWVDRTVRDHGIRRAVVFSGAMAQYAMAANLRVVVDFVDVDSAKWRQYAQMRTWPVSSLYRREAGRLLAFERAIARKAAASVFVTQAEADLFRALAPECAARVHHACNGVDTAYFDPTVALQNPYGPDEEAIAFSGAMDYWPNADAACWFAREALPAIAAARPRARFYVVGMNPTAAVTALAADPRVTVTGRVPDVRPYLLHASAVVAPLRVARGIQNKVLEAMAMARPVVVSQAIAASLSGSAQTHYLVADSGEAFARTTVEAMHDADIGPAARAHVLAEHDWERNLQPFEDLLREPSVVAAPTHQRPFARTVARTAHPS